MGRLPNSWANALSKLRFREKQREFKRMETRQCQFGIEFLEHRRLLAFERVPMLLDPADGVNTTSSTYLVSWAGDDFDGKFGPLAITSDNNSSRAVSPVATSAADEGVDAKGVMHAVARGHINPAFFDGTPWITTQSDNVQLDLSTALNGVGTGRAQPYPFPPNYDSAATAPMPDSFVSAEGAAEFTYVDTTPDSLVDTFHGTIRIIDLGIGLELKTGSGLADFKYRSDSQVSISLGSFSASIQVTGEENDGEVSYTIDYNAPGLDPLPVVTSGGADALVHFSMPITGGDVLTIDGDLSAHGRVFAFAERSFAALGGGEATAQLNFIQSLSAFGSVTEGPPVTPDPVITATTSDGGSPGDLDGDGALRVQDPNDPSGTIVDPDDQLLYEQYIQDAMADYLEDPVAYPLLIVSTEEDESDGDHSFGDLSLREAIAIAGDANHPGQDTILFAPWVNNIDLTQGSALLIDSDIRLLGRGADSLTITGDGQTVVFSVIGRGGDGTELNGLTIADGAGAYVGGIHAIHADLTLIGARVVDNAGGGIYANSTNLTVINSEIADNASSTSGAGIFFEGLFGNSVLDLDIINSTISGNMLDNANLSGGGIYIDPIYDEVRFSLTNSTITNHRSGYAGGLSVAFGVPSASPRTTGYINNSIIAGNITWGDVNAETYWGSTGRVLALDLAEANNNLIGFDLTHHLFAGQDGYHPANIKLGDLSYNGGLTRTHALLAGSAAIDAGSNNFGGTTDQRGYARVGTTDVGAFEYLASAPLMASVGMVNPLQLSSLNLPQSAALFSGATDRTKSSTIVQSKAARPLDRLNPLSQVIHANDAFIADDDVLTTLFDSHTGDHIEDSNDSGGEPIDTGAFQLAFEMI